MIHLTVGVSQPYKWESYKAGVSQPLSEKVTSERFAAPKCELNKGQAFNLPYFLLEIIIAIIRNGKQYNTVREK